MSIKTSQHLWKLLKKSTAVLLLALFSGMPIFELVHTHEQECVSADHSLPQLNKGVAKCKVCDHFTRHQHTPFLAEALLSVSYFEGQSCCMNWVPAEKLAELCGLNWSNKGPPAAV